MRRDSMLEIAKFDSIGGDKFPKFQWEKFPITKEKFRIIYAISIPKFNQGN